MGSGDDSRVSDEGIRVDVSLRDNHLSVPSFTATCRIMVVFHPLQKCLNRQLKATAFRPHRALQGLSLNE